MHHKRFFFGIALLGSLVSFFASTPASATPEITSIALSSNKVTPGFPIEFTLHTEANVRQNVNLSSPVEIPAGWTVEISRNDQYPAGIWGVHRILLPDNNITEPADNVYSFAAPPDATHYRIRLQDPEGNLYGSEVFEVAAEPFVTIRPGRAFEQGGTVEFYIYDEDGNPWNIDTWGDVEGRYNVDVYYFGNSGPISYAAPVGNTPAAVTRVGDGLYSFPAGRVIAEYYLSFYRYSHISVHSSSYNVIAGEAEPEEEPELPPVLEPEEDDTPTDPENNPDVPQHERADEARELQPLECPLEVGKAYKARNSNAVYLVVRPHRMDGTLNTEAKKCTKRAFMNARLFFTYFDSWSEVLVDNSINRISDDTLRFLPLGKKYDPKYGALVKVVSDPKVYLLLGDTRYWITSEAVFIDLRYSWNWIEDVSEDLLDSYQEGYEIIDTSRHPNYTLIKYDGDTRVYRLVPDPNDSTRTVKRHIMNETAFNSLGYRWDRIVTVPNSETYSDGETLSADIPRIILRAR